MSRYVLTELLQGARNCVTGYAGIEKDENVLIWTDRKVNALGSAVDPIVIEALSVACEEVGADVTIMSTEEWRPRLGDPIPRLAERAIYDSNVFINVFALENMAAIDNKYYHRCLLEYDIRNVMFLAITPDILASRWARYPPQLHFSIVGKVGMKLSKDREFHLRCHNGSDFHGRLKGSKVPNPYVNPKADKRDRKVLIFPGGEIADYPVSPVNGTLVFELMEGFRGYLSKPIKLTVEDRKVTKVEGGDEAKWLQRLMKKYRNADLISEIAWGHNPTPSLSRGLLETPDSVLFRRAGSYHAAIGLWYGVGQECDLHWDGGATRCTLQLDGETIIENGDVKVLHDPEIRDLASKYGDPDEMLAYEP